jgi:ABC-type multidrug transport system fused ATPase/permease subunit
MVTKRGFKSSLGEGDPSAWDTLRYILPFSWPAENVMSQVLLVGLILWVSSQRWVNAVIPMQQGRIIDQFYQNNGFPLYDIVFYISMQVLQSSTRLLYQVMWTPLENRSRQIFETLALRKTMDLSADFHDNKRSAELSQSVARGRQVSLLFRTIFLDTVPIIIDFCVTVFVFLQSFGVQIGLIAAVTMAAYVSFYQKMTQRAMLRHEDAMSTMKECDCLRSELITQWRTIVSFNRTEDEVRRYAETVQKDIQKRVEARLWSSFHTATEIVVLNAGLLSALLLITYRISLGEIPLGRFVTLLSYWQQLIQPLTFFARGFESVNMELVDAKKLVEYLKTAPTVTNRPGALPLKVEGGRVEFQHVSFGYDNDLKVLKGITFTCEPGQTIAFVGKTGGGKSTVLQLLFRDYDACSGSIRIDGQDIRDVTIDSLRTAIAEVLQQPQLFNRTIIENLRYANPRASDEQIFQVCKDVEIHEEFCRIGYHQIVGENGVKLSGGQKQRIAIAQALLKDSPIVTFDEPTSAIDSVTESKIQRNLLNHLRGRTVFIVAHRLSTIIHADKILVIENGEIVQQGTHEQLQHHGLYGQLWSEQAASTKSESSDSHSVAGESRVA